tara:strand:+ start:5853 stop:6227 length:375 start_codon:yes stop_codon:yes gene_type:complete
MNKNILSLFCMFFYCLTYSQTDQFNLINNTKFDSLLNIKKQVDKKLFDKNYYSIQVFSGSYKLADSISTFVTEKYTLDSTFFYFETPNYKVRVGKYRSKIIAEKKLKEIKKTFKSAFIFKPKSN